MTYGWAARRIEKTQWPGFLVTLAIWFAYNWWAFETDSPWTRALNAAGGVLPETKPGIPAIEPQRSIEALGSHVGDYLLWQVFDIPYAILNLLVTAGAMALALRATKLGGSPLRFLLYLPVIYVACEIVENAFVAGFAAGVIPIQETFVLIQQLATTVKFSTGMPALALGALSLVIAIIALVLRAIGKRS